MTAWFDFGVYAVFMVVFWFVAASASARWPVILLAQRNPDWLCAHPDALRLMAGSRWHILVGYLIGAVSLTVLVSYQLGLWPLAPSMERWDGLRLITWGSSVLGIVYFVIYGTARAARWKRVIPAAERRQAVLERRSIDDFIPRRLRMATYAVVAVHAGAWVVTGLGGVASSPDHWRRAFIVLVLSGTFSLVFSFMARVMVNRPPNVLDRVLGAGYRRKEVRLAFFPQLLPVAVGLLILCQEVAGLPVIDPERATFLGLTVLLTAGFLAALVQSTAHGPASNPPRSGNTAPGTGGVL